MQADQIALFNEYVELRKNPESNHKRIHRIETILIDMNRNLIYYVARRYPAISQYTQDIHNTGSIALLHALRTYNPNLGDFAPYAVQQLRSSSGIQSIVRFYTSGVINIPHNAFVDYNREKREKRVLIRDNGVHEFTDESLAVDAVIYNMSRFGDPVESSKSNSSVDDMIEQSTFEDPSDALEVDQMNDLLMSVIESLPLREKKVITLLYGLNKDSEELNLRAVGRECELSHEAVRKIRDKTLYQLRKRLLQCV